MATATRRDFVGEAQKEVMRLERAVQGLEKECADGNAPATQQRALQTAQTDLKAARSCLAAVQSAVASGNMGRALHLMGPNRDGARFHC